MSDGSDPIEQDEWLYRRIPVSQNWYDPELGEPPSPKAFNPKDYDDDGLSFSRARYGSPEEEAARGRSGKQYWVAVLKASDITSAGVRLKQDPKPDDAGHVLTPELNYADRKTATIMNKILQISQSCLRVEGPFPGKKLAE